MKILLSSSLVETQSRAPHGMRLQGLLHVYYLTEMVPEAASIENFNKFVYSICCDVMRDLSRPTHLSQEPSELSVQHRMVRRPCGHRGNKGIRGVPGTRGAPGIRGAPEARGTQGAPGVRGAPGFRSIGGASDIRGAPEAQGTRSPRDI